jgi:hypothetical protein
MGLQETAVDEFQVRFKRTRRLSLALRFQGKHKNGGKEETDDTESDCELMERITRDES